MGQDLTQEVEQLKNSIDILSKNLDEGFKTLNQNLSIGFGQISKQIIDLSNQRVLGKEIIDSNMLNNEQVSLPVSPKQPKIPDEYFIDYSYIDTTQYSYWLENLKKYSKSMAECRHKENISNIPNFCKSANDILESAIEVLFDAEYNYLSESNKTFLEAYERTKKTRIEKGWQYFSVKN